jgi:hypothetical protein
MLQVRIFMDVGKDAQTFESLLVNNNEIGKYASQKQTIKLNF